MKAFENTGVVLRAYNNNEGVVKAVARAFNNGIGLVVVVVKDDDPATRGNVRGWLGGLKQTNKERLIILEMRSGYSWSNALNHGFNHIRQHNRLADIRGSTKIDFVVPLSNEVLWEQKHLKAMLAEANSSSRIGVVGTSFRGFENGNPFDLGLSYIHPRNTMSLIRWEAFLAVGHFDAVCDGFGGMEDLHFIMSMVVCGNFEWRIVDLGVKLLVGKNHNQAVKEDRERDAMREIVAYFRSIADGIPELSARIEEALKHFQLGDL